MARIDEEIKTKFNNNRHRFIANLVFTANWFQNSVDDFLKPYDLSLQQNNILRILKGAKSSLTMNQIKELMIEKAPNATRLADKLISKELIERERSATDRRVVYLKITEKGLALLNTIDSNENIAYMTFMNRITEEEAKTVSDILDKIRG
jgi:DNA-binding MarR family transcriptional regulator